MSTYYYYQLKKYYLIQLVDGTQEYWLRKDCKAFHWHNHGNDKQYKKLGAAMKKAKSLLPKLNAPEPKINVVEVSFQPCNPELQEGYYKPVHRVVGSF